ncbi:MAG: phosphoribosylformylglycinamidine synthase subunit PurL [Nitrospirae bacterium]|nr:MAG: phosphoribosylformylglycinamidine synthase subunit PurL [Nitrospirota bacterium]
MDHVPLETSSSSVWSRHGLTPEEYQQIVRHLGREPTVTELGMFSVMWSEHCSYKSSRLHLKRLPTEGVHVLQGPGENAGVLDVGDGLAVVFKIESHNHPSFIEPFQGAATGVGGILRDIFTMGARPLALLNSLRFGDPELPRTRHLIREVVAGIAWYGNCVGVPTVGGELSCHEIYTKNPLVNVLCLGLVKQEHVFRGVAKGEGNLVLYIGAKTGRDGIHGATMASDSFDERSDAKRPHVQVGDPFLEKLLLEACLEMMEQGMIVGIQDMGAAGLTSSSCEMASRAGTGIELELAHVPCREPEMTPYEIMLSESQERMLLVVQADKREQVLAICQKWGVEAAVIGHVTSDGMVRVKHHGEVVAEISARVLTDESPCYERPAAPPSYQELLQSLNVDVLPMRDDPANVLLALLASPAIASKAWIYRQYDHMVGTNTVVCPGSDAAVIRIKGTDKAIALSTDGNSRYCLLNPYMGAMLAVAEAARNVVCAGAKPLGLTDCLNFGNPERPDIMWQFLLVIEGIADACRGLEIPVVSGNVSFYNETNSVSIYPTPVIGMVGLIEPITMTTTQWFQAPGDRILLLGETKEDLGGTEYLKVIHHREQGSPPWLNVERERQLQGCVLDLIRRGWIRSAHDCSEGGLAVTLAECCVSAPAACGRKQGATVTLSCQDLRADAILFGESPSRVVVSVAPECVEPVLHLAATWGIPAALIGEVGGTDLVIEVADGTGRRQARLQVDLVTLFDQWSQSLERTLQMPG